MSQYIVIIRVTSRDGRACNCIYKYINSNIEIKIWYDLKGVTYVIMMAAVPVCMFLYVRLQDSMNLQVGRNPCCQTWVQEL